jgi:hypothetical protein
VCGDVLSIQDKNGLYELGYTSIHGHGESELQHEPPPVRVAQFQYLLDATLHPRKSLFRALSFCGRYKVCHDVAITASLSLDSRTTGRLFRGTLVQVVKVEVEDSRVRGLLQCPRGWVSIRHLSKPWLWLYALSCDTDDAQTIGLVSVELYGGLEGVHVSPSAVVTSIAAGTAASLAGIAPGWRVAAVDAHDYDSSISYSSPDVSYMVMFEARRTTSFAKASSIRCCSIDLLKEAIIGPSAGRPIWTLMVGLKSPLEVRGKVLINEGASMQLAVNLTAYQRDTGLPLTRSAHPQWRSFGWL